MQEISKKLNVLYILLPLFLFSIGLIFLFNPKIPLNSLERGDYNSMVFLLHQGQGVLFMSIALLIFQIRRKSISLYFALTNTFAVIAFSIFLMTCYFYYILPSFELILISIISLFCCIILFYEKYIFRKILNEEKAKRTINYNS